MSGFEITCINRNAQGLIVRIGGAGWSLGTHEAIIKLISQQLRLMVMVDGKLVAVGVRGEGFDAFLALEPDGFPLQAVPIASC